MQPDSSLPCSYKVNSGPWPEPAQFISHPTYLRYTFMLSSHPPPMLPFYCKLFTSPPCAYTSSFVPWSNYSSDIKHPLFCGFLHPPVASFFVHVLYGVGSKDNKDIQNGNTVPESLWVVTAVLQSIQDFWEDVTLCHCMSESCCFKGRQCPQPQGHSVQDWHFELLDPWRCQHYATGHCATAGCYLTQVWLAARIREWKSWALTHA